MTLKVTTKTTHYIDDRDLESFIKETYGIDFNVSASEECGDGTSLTFNINGEIESWNTDYLAQLMAGQWVDYATRLLLDKMCKDGHIPAGFYCIEVSW